MQPPRLSGSVVPAGAWDAAVRALCGPRADAGAGMLARLARALALPAAGCFAAARDELPGLPPEIRPLAAARWLAWTGDLAAMQHLWGDVRAAARRFLDSTPHAGPAVALAAATAAELQRTAADLGDARFAADLAAIARRPPHDLDVLHDATARAVALALGAGVAPDAAADASPGDVAFRPWHGWAALAAGSASAGIPPLLDAAASDPPVFVPAVVHGLLGAAPDATRLRLRLAPLVPPGSGVLRLEDLAFADGAVCLDVRYDTTAATVTVSQDAGGIPFTLLLEPVLPFRPASAEVDGRSASLDVAPRGDGWRVPVQLVLDEERVLRVYGA